MKIEDNTFIDTKKVDINDDLINKNFRKTEIEKELLLLDKEAVRPTRSIKVAELNGLTPDKADIDKLIEIEDKVDSLRAELRSL